MWTTISKTWRFDAAHQLVNHDGKCARPHGHTYSVTIALDGEPRPADGTAKEGMVADYGTLDALWRTVFEPLLDHRDLNESVPIVGPTTAENLAAWVMRACRAADMDPAWVEVSETPSTRARVTREPPPDDAGE